MPSCFLTPLTSDLWNISKSSRLDFPQKRLLSPLSVLSGIASPSLTIAQFCDIFFSSSFLVTLILIILQRSFIMQQQCQLVSQNPLKSNPPQQAHTSKSPPKRAYKDRYKYRHAQIPQIPKENLYLEFQPRATPKNPQYVLKRNWESRAPIIIPNALRSGGNTHFCYNLHRPGLHFDYLSSGRLT